MTDRLTIGFLGGGPVTQAIHLPALATMGDRWRVAKVMDIDPATATAVADRCGAQGVTSAAAIIDDPAIDVVAVCSPNGFHAEQVIAACRAGKKAVLCEKPLAVSREEGAQILAVARETGTAIMVGTMHRYDPGFRAGLDAWTATGDVVQSVKSRIFLPANAIFTDYATQDVPSDKPPAGPPPPAPNPVRLRNTILGLAIHHVPLVRAFFPDVGRVLSARHVPGFGYTMFLADGATSADLQAFMPGNWPPSWTFAVQGADHRLEVDFPPSYVMAGSGSATLAGRSSTRGFVYDENGYQAQWRNLHDVVTGAAAPLASLEDAVADLEFALDLVDRAVACLEATA